MSRGTEIRIAAEKMFAGTLPADSGPMLCLKFARMAIEQGLKKPSHWFYRFVVKSPRRPDFYASDAEKSLRARGWAVTGTP